MTYMLLALSECNVIHFKDFPGDALFLFVCLFVHLSSLFVCCTYTLTLGSICNSCDVVFVQKITELLYRQKSSTDMKVFLSLVGLSKKVLVDSGNK